jgi:hypothetical protein
LLDNPPKGSQCLRFVVKEILEESTRIEGWWISIPLTFLTESSDPICWPARIGNLEEASGIERGASDAALPRILYGEYQKPQHSSGLYPGHCDP